MGVFSRAPTAAVRGGMAKSRATNADAREALLGGSGSADPVCRSAGLSTR